MENSEAEKERERERERETEGREREKERENTFLWPKKKLNGISRLIPVQQK